jgi:hypothetical protein
LFLELDFEKKNRKNQKGLLVSIEFARMLNLNFFDVARLAAANFSDLNFKKFDATILLNPDSCVLYVFTSQCL